MERLTDKKAFLAYKSLQPVNVVKVDEEETFKVSTMDATYLVGSAVDKLAEYEELEEQGLILRLPVPEGTTVYQLGYICNCKFDYQCPLYGDDADVCIMGISCENEEKVWKVKEIPFIWKMLKSVGSTIFLTKEEAEAALAKMEEV